MPGVAQDLIVEFWRRQDGGDYTTLVELFAADAVLVDPEYGTFEGIDAIGSFMAKMVEVATARSVRFELLEVAGDDTAAWARWVARTPAGDRSGCGVYRVANGKLTFYRDYLDPPPA